MLKIGEFAKRAQISIRMLRHYDDLGLLKPLHVDHDTGYRYYGLEQLPRLNRLLALKDLGLPRKELRLLQDNALSADEIRGLLKLRQVQLRQHINEEQERLRRVEDRLCFIEQEGQMPEAEIVLKAQPALSGLSLHGTVWAGTLFADSYPVIQAHGLRGRIRGLMTFYHGSLEFERTRQPLAQYQVEVVYVVDQPVESPIPLADGRQLTVQTYPALPLVASLISTRPDHERWQDAELSWRWLHQRDYRLAAPTREIYLRRPRHHGEYLTEIQFPLVSKEKES